MLSVRKQYPSSITDCQMWSCLFHPSRMSFTYRFPHRSRTGSRKKIKIKIKESLKSQVALSWKSKLLFVSMAFSPLSGLLSCGLLVVYRENWALGLLKKWTHSFRAGREEGMFFCICIFKEIRVAILHENSW